MLLITRRPGEAIVVNGSITVKVVDIRGGRVKLGFEFPNGNTVYREELFAKIQEENRAAALPGGTAVQVESPGKGSGKGTGQAPLAAVLKAIPSPALTISNKTSLTTTNNKDHKDNATGTNPDRAGRNPNDHDQ